MRVKGSKRENKGERKKKITTGKRKKKKKTRRLVHELNLTNSTRKVIKQCLHGNASEIEFTFGNNKK